ncbi:PqqD family peptide modification chaperone [Halomonas sp. 18H]|nr:PqqD family peptide modification chaperone [Halomonas sp. 18H]MCW4152141.1 PqqD family peptide modification chaperone [Halomonas sp. 18H]
MTDSASRCARYWLGGKRADEQDRFFREALEARGWQAGSAEDWQAGWFTGTPSRQQFARMAPGCKLNHLPGNNALTLKSRLFQSLEALRHRQLARFGEGSSQVARLQFFPRAYLMPSQYSALQEAALANPEQRWILKPSNASKGKGIKLLADTAEAPRKADWLVQEYLDNPHTIRGHKYVLRLYVLLASLNPLRVYVYRQGFAKLASAPYDVNDADNPYSQLTNPDINIHNTDADVAVEFIDMDRYRQWLHEQGHDDEQLFARVHDLLALTMLSSVDHFRHRCEQEEVDASGGYELLGIDCLVDGDLKPWILECNLSPSLGVCAGPDSGGPMEETVKQQLVEDMLSLVDIDGQDLPDSDDTSAVTLLAETRREKARAGDFVCLYPTDFPEDYLDFFTFPGLLDWRLASALRPESIKEPVLEPGNVDELIEDESLALYDTRSGKMLSLNDTAALIWLLASQGETPSAIVKHLRQAAGGDHGAMAEGDTIECHVWSCLEHWCREGLLNQSSSSVSTKSFQSAKVEPDIPTEASAPRCLAIGARRWAVYCDSPAVMERLSGAFISCDDELLSSLPNISLLDHGDGYSAILSDNILVEKTGLTDLGPELVKRLGRAALPEGYIMLDVPFIIAPGAPERGILLSPDIEDLPVLADLLADAGYKLVRGAAMGPAGPDHLQALGMPMVSRGGELLPLPAPETKSLTLVAASKFSADETPLNALEVLADVLPDAMTAEHRVVDADSVATLHERLLAVPRECLLRGCATSLKSRLQALLPEAELLEN